MYGFYGYYAGYGLTRIHLGDFDNDIQACYLIKIDSPTISWNHHFHKNQHGYTSATVWVDNELIIDKAPLKGNASEWSDVCPTTAELQKWIAKCDINMHKLHIKYLK